ncbi:MAG: sulfite exporter TauE/SafE family protein [Actinomycetota bacterium]|nr:sulfite exporter TauE/SafE family protein [Actinomycetota bacterium]
MAAHALTVGVGLLAGLLSGAFGVGGGVVTTPAIRLLLAEPALVAVGTPLVVIIPTAITGAWSYARRGMADSRVGLLIGAWGIVGTIVGAWGSARAGGSVVMIVTALLIGYMAVDMLRHAADLPVDGPSCPPVAESTDVTSVKLAFLGGITGLYSGFLGLGGGFVLVPMLSRVFGFPIKRAIGTSLVAIAVLAVPGAATHWVLGHVNVALAAWLALGVVPGVLVGARLTAAANERHVRIAFAVLLGATGAILAANEFGWM